MFADATLAWLCFVIAAAPATVFGALALSMLLGRPPSERTTGHITLAASGIAFTGAVLVLVGWLEGERAAIDLRLGVWFGVGHYAFELDWLIDRLTVTLLPLISGVVLVIARFAIPYLHRETGFTRFFVQLMLFATGMSVIVLAGSADVLIIGWECVGLSSALLIAFFQERAAPPRAALRVFTTYRLCDVGLLVGVILLHIVAGTADFARAFGTGAWPGTAAPLGGVAATAMALAFGVAAAGKSAQVPVGNWLARAMEGPTPSSALFYGGPAVHAGVILLMRLAPLYAEAPIAAWLLVLVGVLTSIHATLAWRAQTDQKSALAFATMTQLGIIVVECGLGFWNVALFHTVAHVCLRTFQLLRAPSALRDAQILRATNRGEVLETPGVFLGSEALRRRLYAIGLSRSHLDDMLDRYVVEPVVALGRRLDAGERRWLDVLGEIGRPDETERAPGRGSVHLFEEETP